LLYKECSVALGLRYQPLFTGQKIIGKIKSYEQNQLAIGLAEYKKKRRFFFASLCIFGWIPPIRVDILRNAAFSKYMGADNKII